MFDDGKLGTVLAAGAGVFVVAFVLFFWLFGFGFYISSALGAVAAVTLIWWMGIEDAETVEDEPGHGRVTSKPIIPVSAADEDTLTGTTSAVEVTPLEEAEHEPLVPEELADDAVTAPVPDPIADTPPDKSYAERPTLLRAPEGEPDDLTRIKGVGPKLKEMLNGMGVWHFHQIAGWSEAELDWVDDNLEGFKGRARRDDWVGQAKDLA